jgi:hypothetical protein
VGWLAPSWLAGQSSCGYSVGEPFPADQLSGTLDSGLACKGLFYSDSLGEIVGNNCRLCVLRQLLEFDRNGVMICCCNQACDGLCVGMVFVCNSSMPDMPDMPIHILSNTFTQIFHWVFGVLKAQPASVFGSLQLEAGVFSPSSSFCGWKYRAKGNSFVCLRACNWIEVSISRSKWVFLCFGWVPYARNANECSPAVPIRDKKIEVER